MSFRGFKLVCYLANSVCTYRQEVLRLETTQKLKSHVMAWLLVFEAKLTNMVSMWSTGVCRVVSMM